MFKNNNSNILICLIIFMLKLSISAASNETNLKSFNEVYDYIYDYNEYHDISEKYNSHVNNDYSFALKSPVSKLIFYYSSKKEFR